MDLAALSLEDSFPDLTPQQVRDALAQANGDLALAEQLCHRLLGAAEAGPAPQPAQQQHRQWWPPAAVPAHSMPGLAEEHNPGSPAVFSGSQPTSLPGVQSSQPAVRVLQHHGRTSEGSNSNIGGNGLLLGGAASETQAKDSEEGIHYAAVFLSESSRDRVLQFAPPLHEAVSADHLTMAYCPSLRTCLELPLGREAQLFVEGVASDYRAQALAVQFPSWLPYLSDAAPHVTVSVTEGVPAREAGDLIGEARKGQRARIVPLVSMKLLHGTVGVKLRDGSIAYSEEELKEGLLRQQRRAAPISQAGPVRILKRGEAPPPQQQQQQQQPQQQQQQQQAPAVASRRVSFGGVEVRSPPPAGFAPASAQQQQQELELEERQPPAGPPPATLAPTISEAAPTLDDLLDMLYLEDTAAAAGSAAAPSVPSTSSAQQQQRRRQQQQRPRPSPPGKQPGSGVLAGRDKTQRSTPQRQPQPQPLVQQQQALAAGEGLGFGAAAGVEDEDGGPLDLLSSLAERLAGGGHAPAPQQPAVSPPSPTSVPPPFNALPLFREALPQPPLGMHSGGKPPGAGPAPARTLGDFLPGPLAGSSSAAGPPPPPLPFFLDAPAAGPLPPAMSSAAAAGGVRGQRQHGTAGSRPLRRQSSGAAASVGGYESSSSSGADGRSEWESGAGGGAGLYPSSSAAFTGIQTEAELQQAFPFAEAEVLSAALEIHGGDAAEAASFLAALEMNHQDQGLIEGSAPDLGTQSLHHHHHHQQQQQQRSHQSRPLQQGAGGGSGQRRTAGRPGSGSTAGGRGRGRSHTGASDPLAVAERQAMSLHFAAKNIYEKAARAAAARGAHALSKELAATSRHHADLGSAARRRANSTAYRTSNSGVTNTFKVDLHGLHVEEALQVLERHLVSLGGLGHPGGIILEVITGVGRHSSAGQPRLLPAVVRYLADAGYRFDTREGNTGVVDVFLGC